MDGVAVETISHDEEGRELTALEDSTVDSDAVVTTGDKSGAENTKHQPFLLSWWL